MATSSQPFAIFCISLDQPHQILGVNALGNDVLGYSEQELQGCSVQILYGPRTDTNLFCQALVGSTRKRSNKVQIALYDRYEQKRNVILTFAPYYSGTGKIIASTVAFELSEAITLPEAFEEKRNPWAIVSVDWPHLIQMVNDEFASDSCISQTQAMGQSLEMIVNLNVSYLSTVIQNTASNRMCRGAIIAKLGSHARPTTEINCIPVVEAHNGSVRHVMVLFEPFSINDGITCSAFNLQADSSLLPRQASETSKHIFPCTPNAAPAITLDLLQSLSDLPLFRAAEKLGVSAVDLKKTCRALGLQRWLYQKKAPRPQPAAPCAVDQAYVRKLYRKYSAKTSKNHHALPTMEKTVVQTGGLPSSTPRTAMEVLLGAGVPATPGPTVFQVQVCIAGSDSATHQEQALGERESQEACFTPSAGAAATATCPWGPDLDSDSADLAEVEFSPPWSPPLLATDTQQEVDDSDLKCAVPVLPVSECASVAGSPMPPSAAAGPLQVGAGRLESLRCATPPVIVTSSESPVSLTASPSSTRSLSLTPSPRAAPALPQSSADSDDYFFTGTGWGPPAASCGTESSPAAWALPPAANVDAPRPTCTGWLGLPSDDCGSSRQAGRLAADSDNSLFAGCGSAASSLCRAPSAVGESSAAAAGPSAWVSMSFLDDELSADALEFPWPDNVELTPAMPAAAAAAASGGGGGPLGPWL